MKATLPLLAALLLGGTAAAQNNQPDDHPNLPPGTPVTIGADGTASTTGVINYPDAKDVFSFQVGANAMLTVYTTGMVDTSGVLRRASNTAGGQTTIATDEGGTGNFRISRAVGPGLYSIQVAGRMSPAAFVHQYGLRIEITPNDPLPPPGPPDVMVPEIPQGGTLAFGSHALNTTTTKTFVVKNTGQSNLLISSITVSGANSAGTTGPFFISEGGVARTLAPGAQTTVSVGFRPFTAGNFTGQVRINSNDPDENPYSFIVTGSGVSEPPPPPPVQGEIAVSLGDADLPSGGEVHFGIITVPSNGTTVRELIISNTGDTNLRIGGVAIAPLPTANPLPAPPPGFFRVLTPPAPVVEPGRSTVLRIAAGGNDANQLLPAVQRYTMQALIENSDNDENPYRLLLHAEVQSPPPPAAGEIDVFSGDVALTDDGTLDFGTTQTGTPVTKTLTIRNTGEGHLRIEAITVEWAGPIIAIFPPPPPPFRVEGVEPRIVAPGASTTCRVIFPATHAGSYDSLLNIRSSDADENPFTLLLTAKAEGDAEPPPAPEIAVSMGNADLPQAGTIDFGRTSLTVPVRKTITISNRGTATLNVRTGIQPVTREVNTTLPFRLSGEPVSSVPAGASRALTVVFQPMKNGSVQAMLVISNNDADENPYRLKLTGHGGTDPAAVPDIGLSLGDTELGMNALIDFGTAAPGTSVRNEVRITNSGLGDLRLGRISFSASNAGGKPGNGGVDPNGVILNPPVGANPFRALPPPNNVVPAGRSAILQLVYVAPPSGSQQAVLSIESNDPDESPWRLNLNGASSGVAPTPPEIGVRSGDAELPIGGVLDFGKVRIGSPVRREITVANTGGGDLRISGFSILPAEYFANEVIVFLPPNALVRVVSGPGIIPPGKSAGYVLEMIGFYPGDAVFHARIVNNDPDENPYTFRVTGSVMEPIVVDPPIIVDPPGNDPPGGIAPN